MNKLIYKAILFYGSIVHNQHYNPHRHGLEVGGDIWVEVALPDGPGWRKLTKRKVQDEKI